MILLVSQSRGLKLKKFISAKYYIIKKSKRLAVNDVVNKFTKIKSF